MPRSIGLCRDCGRLTLDSATPCRWCARDIENPRGFELADPNAMLGLIGFTFTGKTVYLATLHDQLMHAAPEWQVDVGDRAFRRLTDDFRDWRSCGLPSKTAGDAAAFFLMKVRWKRDRLNLLMWDIAGESYQNLAEEPGETTIGPYCPDGGLRGPEFLEILGQCRCVLVAIGAFRRDFSDAGMRPAPAEEDQQLAQLFRLILRRDHRLRRAIPLLIGADVYGKDPAEAYRRAAEDFHATYRVFTGVLKNQGVAVDTVPVSNLGFGNRIGKDPDNGQRRPAFPPSPHNVLEPLRRAFPEYFPWWSRLRMDVSKALERRRGKRPAGQAPGPAQIASAASGSVFISYRREGGADTARLVRNELQARGWKVFLDVEDLGAQHFDDRILLEIQDADNFVSILSPGSLDRCASEKDWVRREIAHALSTGRHIVPVLKEGFAFPPAESLPEPIRDLARFNGVAYSHEFFAATIDKIASFLKPAEA